MPAVKRAVAAVAAAVAVCAVVAAPVDHGVIHSFDEIDADGSGGIGFVEWSSFFLELHDAPAGEFEAVDVDRDGRVSLQEYRQFKLVHSREFHPDSHEPNFGIIDGNSDNHLSTAEYSRMVQVYRDSPTNSVDRWAVMDADEDGSVTREEFVAGVAVNVAEFKKRKAQEARQVAEAMGAPQDFVRSTSYSQILRRYRESEKCPLDVGAFAQIDCVAIEVRFDALLHDISARGEAGQDITEKLAELRRFGLELLKSVYTRLPSTDDDERELDVPLFELLLLLFRRENDPTGIAPQCGAVESARDAALALTGQLNIGNPSSSATLNLSTVPSKLSPYSIISDILVYSPLDLQLLRGALVAGAPSGPILYHGAQQEGVSMLLLAARTAKAELPRLLTQYARILYTMPSSGDALEREYLAPAGYEGNSLAVLREGIPHLREFSPSFASLDDWIKAQVTSARASVDAGQKSFFFGAGPGAQTGNLDPDVDSDFTVFGIDRSRLAELSSASELHVFRKSNGQPTTFHGILLQVAHEMSAAAMTLLFDSSWPIGGFDMRQVSVLTGQFGFCPYHFMALEGCTPCIHALADRLLNASHEEVAPRLTNFQRQLLAHGAGLSAESSVTRRNPFSYAMAYWTFAKDKSPLVTAMVEIFRRQTFLDIFAENPATAGLYNISTLYPDFSLDKGRTDVAATVGIMDSRELDVYGRQWLDYGWPNPQFQIQGCRMAQPLKPKVMNIQQCMQGVTVRAMRDIFGMSLAPVAVPDIGGNFVNAGYITGYSSHPKIRPNTWQSINEIEFATKQQESNLRAVVADMRSLFDFPGVGKQPGNTFTLPPVGEWRLFFANGDSRQNSKFTVNTYVPPAARGMRAFFLVRGTVRWTFQNSLEAAKDTDARGHDLDASAFKGQVLMLPAHWEAWIDCTSETVLVEGVGLEFEEHDVFHLVNWPDPFVDAGTASLETPHVQPGGFYTNAGRTYRATTPLPPPRGAKFINESYPGVQQVHDSPNVFIVDDFLTVNETRFLVQIAQPELRPSKTAANTVFDIHRTSYSVSTEATHRVDWLVRKAHRLTGIPISHYESPQIARYLGGQYYRVHDDAFSVRSAQGRSQVEYGGQRCATVLMYLNDVEDGGATHYPALEHLRVKPKRGRAVVFFPVLRDHEPDPRMGHEAEPTGVNATKYVSQLWIRCSTIPVKTVEGTFTGSYSSLVAKMRTTKPAQETENILAYDPSVHPLPEPWEEELLHLGSRAAQEKAKAATKSKPTYSYSGSGKAPESAQKTWARPTQRTKREFRDNRAPTTPPTSRDTVLKSGAGAAQLPAYQSYSRQRREL